MLTCPLCDGDSLATYVSLDRWSIKYGWTLHRIIGSNCACEGLKGLSRAYTREVPGESFDAIFFYDGESSPDEIEAALACTGVVQYSLNLDLC